MYERFTDRARKVMQLANQEAQRFNHETIGTEHILLGLVKEGTGVAANVLKNLDIDLRKIRLEVEKLMRSGPEMVTMGKLPMTPNAKKVMDCAIEEANGLNHNYVGTEHLLLGLLREQAVETVAAHVLTSLGLKLEILRQEVMSILGNCKEDAVEKKSLNLVMEMASQHFENRMVILSGLAKNFLGQTGLTADKVELCEQTKDGKTTWWFQERKTPATIKAAPTSQTEQIAPGVFMEADTAPFCACKSLLNGHDADCPLAGK